MCFLLILPFVLQFCKQVEAEIERTVQIIEGK